MIIPGLDRLEGTAVNGELLNSDDLWHEHTSEILELLEQENEGKAPEERVSMVQFCAAYASGARVTTAMRRALARKDWKVDPLAVRLLAEDSKARKHSEKPELESTTNRRSRQRNKAPVIARVGTKKRVVDVPGIVYAAGASFPYRAENTAIRSGLKRLRDILALDGFYCTPEHSCHVTIATIQKYRDEELDQSRPSTMIDINEVVAKLRGSALIEAELAKGPIVLVADRLDIPGAGDTIILQFKDESGRFEALRSAVNSTLGDGAPDMRIPSFIHCSLARVVAFPSCSREVMLQKLQGIVEDIEVTLDTIDLFLEDREPYFNLFPDGAVAHWDLKRPTVATGTSKAEDKVVVAIKEDDSDGSPDNTSPSKGDGASSSSLGLPASLVKFLETDEAVLLSLGLIVLSILSLYAKS